MRKVHREYHYNIVWFDDQEEVFDSSKGIEHEFSSQYGCKLDFQLFTDENKFQTYVQKNGAKIDFLFLDIDLNNSERTGIDLYREIRNVHSKMKIVFVSARLNEPSWQSNIESLREKDENLFTLPLNFPTRRIKDKYHELVIKPILGFINAKSQYFDFDYDEFLKMDSSSRTKIIEAAINFSIPFVKNYFDQHKDTQWIIVGEEPEKILKTGNAASPLTTQQLIKLSEERGITVTAYKREKHAIVESSSIAMMSEYITQAKPISIQTTTAKILHVEDDYVILKCLLDEQNRKFQIRKFDLEPFVNVVSLEVNNIVEIKVTTYPGQRVFRFRNGTPDRIDQFSKNHLKSVHAHYKFTPLPPFYENNF